MVKLIAQIMLVLWLIPALLVFVGFGWRAVRQKRDNAVPAVILYSGRFAGALFTALTWPVIVLETLVFKPLE